MTNSAPPAASAFVDRASDAGPLVPLNPVMIADELMPTESMTVDQAVGGGGPGLDAVGAACIALQQVRAGRSDLAEYSLQAPG